MSNYAPDPIFCYYIQEKRNKREDGEQIQWHSLLKFGLGNFKNLVDYTTWAKSDPLEAKFIVLRTIENFAIESVGKMNRVQKEISNNNEYVYNQPEWKIFKRNQDSPMK